MELSIIIVNYNVKDFTALCLHSVLKAIKNIEAEILVADNNSDDGSVAYLSSLFPSVIFITNKKNIGFAAANNQLAKIAKGNFLLCLNPDTVVPEDALEKCLSFMRAHDDAGALGVHLINNRGKFLRESKRGFPSPKTAFYKLSGLANLFPSSPVFAKYYLGNLSASSTQNVEILTGAFMLIRKTVWEKTGGFDEAFFMYGEDIDLSWRIIQQGYNNYYFADVSILHFKGESTAKGSMNYVKIFYKAMSIFAKKHLRARQAAYYHWGIQAAIRLRAGISVVSGLFPKKNISAAKKNILLAGSEEDKKNIADLLQRARGIKLTAVVITDNTTEKNIDVQAMEKMIASKKINEIIFSVDAFSFNEIISFMQSTGGKIKYSFYIPEQRIIAGSSFPSFRPIPSRPGRDGRVEESPE